MNPDNSKRPDDGNLTRTGRDKIDVSESDNNGPAIAPQQPGSMPRAEDDDVTFDNSPEFSDRRPAERGPHRGAPQRDHSERAAGGDQDIDTAGMVPGNKATKSTDPVGF